MRGGAIPVFLWGTGLLVLLTINAIWTRDSIQIEMFAFAVTVIWGSALVFTLLSRVAARRGPPELRTEAEAAPGNSFASALLGIAIGAMLFGAIFGKFLVYMGGGLWVAAFGRLIVEVRAQRRFLRSIRGERR